MKKNGTLWKYLEEYQRKLSESSKTSVKERRGRFIFEDGELAGVEYDLDEKELTIPYDVPALFFSPNLLYTTTALPESVKKIIITEDVRKIGNSAFEKTMLTEAVLGGSIEYIGESSFAYTRLKSITIPEKVVRIENRTFSGCTRLEEVMIPGKIESIGDKAFYYCKRLEKIDIPDSVSFIGKEAFGNCERLKAVKIPEGVTRLFEEVFYNCRDLEEVLLPDSLTEIADRAFFGCDYLKRIRIPAGVRSIGREAFCGCENISELVLHDGMTALEAGTFKGCLCLERISIPASVTWIADNAFDEKLTDYLAAPRLANPELTIIAPKGSYAIKYAIDHGINYQKI